MGQTDHDPAKARFLTIQAVRLSGVVTAVLGALVLKASSPARLPAISSHWRGEMFILPIVLAKRWRSGREAVLRASMSNAQLPPSGVPRRRPLKTQGGGRVVDRRWQKRSQANGMDRARRSIRRAYRDMADYALDTLPEGRTAAIAKLLRYAETDTLCYRADPDEPLWHRQRDMWDPLVETLEAREGIVLERVSGVVAKPHAPATMDRLKARLESLDDFTLAALEQLTALSASLCVGLAALDHDADGEALWAAANLEEDWQIEQWGADEEAAARRAKRLEAFLKATPSWLLGSARLPRRTRSMMAHPSRRCRCPLADGAMEEQIFAIGGHRGRRFPACGVHGFAQIDGFPPAPVGLPEADVYVGIAIAALPAPIEQKVGFVRRDEGMGQPCAGIDRRAGKLGRLAFAIDNA